MAAIQGMLRLAVRHCHVSWFRGLLCRACPCLLALKHDISAILLVHSSCSLGQTPIMTAQLTGCVLLSYICMHTPHHTIFTIILACITLLNKSLVTIILCVFILVWLTVVLQLERMIVMAAIQGMLRLAVRHFHVSWFRGLLCRACPCLLALKHDISAILLVHSSCSLGQTPIMTAQLTGCVLLSPIDMLLHHTPWAHASSNALAPATGLSKTAASIDTVTPFSNRDIGGGATAGEAHRIARENKTSPLLPCQLIVRCRSILTVRVVCCSSAIQTIVISSAWAHYHQPIVDTFTIPFMNIWHTWLQIPSTWNCHWARSSCWIHFVWIAQSRGMKSHLKYFRPVTDGIMQYEISINFYEIRAGHVQIEAIYTH